MKHKMLIAALIVIGFSLSGACNALSVLKPDGTRSVANIDGNKLMLRDATGKLWLLASDGTYTTDDGRTLYVKAGIIGPIDNKAEVGVIAPMSQGTDKLLPAVQPSAPGLGIQVLQPGPLIRQAATPDVKLQAVPPSAPRPTTKMGAPLTWMDRDLSLSYISVPRVIVRGGKIAFFVVDANVTNLGKQDWFPQTNYLVASQLLDGLPTVLSDGRPIKSPIMLGRVWGPAENMRAGFVRRFVMVYGAQGQIASPSEPTAWEPQAEDSAFTAFGLGRTYTLTVAVVGGGAADQRAENNVNKMVFYVGADGVVSDCTMYFLVGGELFSRDIGSRRPETAPTLDVSQAQLRTDMKKALQESARLFRTTLPDSDEPSVVGGSTNIG